VLLGIVLRGAAFVFRAYSRQGGQTGRRWGWVFGGASTITPLLLGMCMAAVSTGHIRVLGGSVEVTGASWLSPLAITIGFLALALCAYLAAVYLANEEEGALQEDFRREALIAGTVTVVLSALLIPVMRTEAPHLWLGLFSARALPVVLVGTAAALAAGWWLRTRRFRLARTAAAIQVSALLSGWMLAEYPYIIYPDLTIQSAAAPPATLKFFLVTLPLGALLLLPSLWYLFRVFKGDVLDLTRKVLHALLSVCRGRRSWTCLRRGRSRPAAAAV
jgi:cytochrome d ubiquinol oxidase subunit II